jgi:cation:H+ antiporter
MVYLVFFLSALIVVAAATRLASYGDTIAVRARLGGMFIGTLLLAGATSLPELLSAINALSIGVPDLAAGSMFGSGMFNMFMLALLDLLYQQARVLRRVANTHALTASLANLLTGLAVLFILADIDLRIGWVGLDSLVIIALYIGGVRLLQRGSSAETRPAAVPESAAIPSLSHALIGFGIATLVLVLITPTMVRERQPDCRDDRDRGRFYRRHLDRHRHLAPGAGRHHRRRALWGIRPGGRQPFRL